MNIYKFNNKCPQIDKNAYVFDNVTIIGQVIIEEDVNIWPGVVIRGDKEEIIIKKGSNIQDNSILHTDPGYPLIVEEYSTIGHGVILHGCTVGSCSTVGMGSIILNKVVIGNNCFVTSNSVLGYGPKYSSDSIISGNPAKIISKNYTKQSKESALEYIELSKIYNNDSLKKITY